MSGGGAGGGAQDNGVREGGGLETGGTRKPVVLNLLLRNSYAIYLHIMRVYLCIMLLSWKHIVH